jgi:two-component system OmpR family response regulator
VIGDFTLDSLARTVYREDELIPLTAREFTLFELFAMNQGQVVTRTQIYEHLYDENDDSLSNLIDVHVSNLRRKLGKDTIVTRRGQGYLLHG